MSASSLASAFNARHLQAVADVSPKPVANNTPVDTSLLGYEQAAVFEAMENTNECTFITGRAGTGKSYLLRFFVNHSHKKVVVVAPTGVAAINIGGQTIHSFFKIPPTTPIDKEALVKNINDSRRAIYKNLDTVVVDEVSMVRSDIMDAIDYVLQKANESPLPFGGKQMLLFGDLYQLPPVAGPQEKRYLDDTFGGAFFFYAPAIKNSSLRHRELTHIFRQKDPTFISILNEVRDGTISLINLEKLNKRSVPIEDEEPAIIIAPRKDDVERYNTDELNCTDDPIFTYEAIVKGDIRANEFPVQRLLKLRVDAPVMMLVNDPGTGSDRPDENRRWVNGTLAQVSRLTNDQIWVMINGVSHQIERTTWRKIYYSYDVQRKQLCKRVVASVTQFPVMLAWAITIHKAQGATYQSVGVDLTSGIFAEGQVYVALSRCVDMNKLYLTRPVEHQDIKVSNEVKAYMNKQESSNRQH